MSTKTKEELDKSKKTLMDMASKLVMFIIAGGLGGGVGTYTANATNMEFNPATYQTKEEAAHLRALDSLDRAFVRQRLDDVVSEVKTIRENTDKKLDLIIQELRK